MLSSVRMASIARFTSLITRRQLAPPVAISSAHPTALAATLSTTSSTRLRSSGSLAPRPPSWPRACPAWQRRTSRGALGLDGETLRELGDALRGGCGPPTPGAPGPHDATLAMSTSEALAQHGPVRGHRIDGVVVTGDGGSKIAPMRSKPNLRTPSRCRNPRHTGRQLVDHRLVGPRRVRDEDRRGLDEVERQAAHWSCSSRNSSSTSSSRSTTSEHPDASTSSTPRRSSSRTRQGPTGP